MIERIHTLEQLIAMLRDDDWRLEGADRTRILDAIAYFVDPDDLIPDRIPGIGFLDDAIMVELVASELTHEIEAYKDFCEYRKRHPKSDELVATSNAGEGRGSSPSSRLRQDLPTESRVVARYRGAVRSIGEAERRAFGSWPS